MTKRDLPARDFRARLHALALRCHPQALRNGFERWPIGLPARAAGSEHRRRQHHLHLQPRMGITRGDGAAVALDRAARDGQPLAYRGGRGP